MELTIRKANATDMPFVLELIKELARFENEPDAVRIDAQVLVQEGFGENPLFTCFVAEVDNQIVGAALIYFRFSTWTGKTVHLEDLIVKQSMRGKGVGQALYTKVMEFASDHDVKRVEWVVLDWNEGAIAFYEKSGAKMLKDWYLVQMNETGIKNYLRK